jgi:hypothetical protein
MPDTISAPPRRRGRRVVTVFVTVAAAALAVGLNVSPAAALGFPSRTCPSGHVTSVDDIADFPYMSSGPKLLDAGFYAGSGGFSPPDTKILCQTVPGAGALAGQPLLKLFTGSCPAGYLPFGIPLEHANGFGVADQTSVTWGSFLPAGWYALGKRNGVGGASWVTMCWFPKAPFNPTVPG